MTPRLCEKPTLRTRARTTAQVETVLGAAGALLEMRRQRARRPRRFMV